MAIYTQYGRYEKARAFKHWADTEGDVYMLLGFGNPRWDFIDSSDISQAASMPIAPYNTSIIGYSDADRPDNPPVEYNQFYDDKVNMSFYKSGVTPVIDTPLIGGVPNIIDGDNYINLCKNLVPPFPCWWSVDSGNIIEFSDGVTAVLVDLNRYDKYYIIKSSDDYVLYDIESVDPPCTINFPTGDSLEDTQKRQYFSELYLRGLAIQNDICHPVGLLGAVRCSVDLVRDIGNDESVYTGELNQFWYGDRYWETVNIDEGNEIDGYIDDANGKSILPCHLAFTATIPPMFLCGNINIDQNLSPRQIAIFTRNRVNNEKGPNYYRVDENIFNLGQYYKVDSSSDFTPEVPSGINMLNFTLPCTIDYPDKEHSTEKHVYPYNSDGTDFKFLLGDYLRGSIKNIHSAERIGYVVGF